MLGDAKVHSVVAVKNLEAAKKFYGRTLGLKLIDENPGGMLYQSGGNKVFVYQSEFAGSNKATAVSWEIDNVEPKIEELKSKGVTFEHYDNMPGVKLQGDVHIMGTMKAAWFKDPDGNILCIGNAM